MGCFSYFEKSSDCVTARSSWQACPPRPCIVELKSRNVLANDVQVGTVHLRWPWCSSSCIEGHGTTISWQRWRAWERWASAPPPCATTGACPDSRVRLAVLRCPVSSRGVSLFRSSRCLNIEIRQAEPNQSRRRLQDTGTHRPSRVQLAGRVTILYRH